jgi:glycosyltransferase involved in cell wall biosynthesis
MYHADLVGGLAARWSLHCPVVWGIRNSNLDPQKTSRSTRLVVKICALLSRWIPAIIVSCSQQAAQVHRELGYRADRFRVIPNGYDLKRLAPDLASRSRQRQEWGVAEDELLLGMVARWDPQKDHANLFAALSLLAQAGCYVRCVLAGPGMTAETPRLMRLVHRYQLQDRLILNGPSDDVPSVMNALDVLVLSSEYGEAFPNVVAEAMACGTPCVVTDVGDAAYIVSDNGWVVPPADPRALAEAIGQALKAVSSRGKTALGLAARERIAERFSMESVTRRYTELYEGLVS